MRWNTPLSADHAELLLDRLDLRPGLRIADLGCGWGELLLSALARGGPGTTGIGVDTDAALLAKARQEAVSRGLDAEFLEADVAGWRGTADRALCTGAAHAYGGTAAALSAAAKVVLPGGRLLYGDGCWAQPPTEAAVQIFGEETMSLADLLEACRAAGWRVIHQSTASEREWDDFESTFRAGRQEWLLANQDHPRAAEIRDFLDTREREYINVYRGVLGFAYLVLAH